MWVRAKDKIQLAAKQEDCQITYSTQSGSKWLAFFEPGVVPALPWRVQHKYLNVRMTEDRFRELFEETRE